MTHVTCRLTAKTRDQLRNPTLGNRVWTTITFLRAFSCRPYVPQVLWASTRQHESPVPSQCKSRAHSVWMWALFTCLKIIVSNMDYGGVQLWCVCVSGCRRSDGQSDSGRRAVHGNTARVERLVLQQRHSPLPETGRRRLRSLTARCRRRDFNENKEKCGIDWQGVLSLKCRLAWSVILVDPARRRFYGIICAVSAW